jgi:membrane protease YdiL (CAAX protease family)
MMPQETVAASPAADLSVAADGVIPPVVEIGPSEMALAMVSLLILFAMASSIITWILLLRRRVPFFGEHALVPERPRPRPHWNAAFFVIFFGFLIFTNAALNMMAVAAGFVEPPTQVTLAETDAAPAGEPTATAADDTPPESTISVVQILTSTSSMVAATICTMLLVLIVRPILPNTPTPGRAVPAVGWLPVRGDLWLGLKAAWLILPVTMIMMGLVSLLQKYSHPVLDALKPDGPDAAPDFGIFAALFFSTAIITPLVEEFWFRGMLQGGLQRLADSATDARRWMVTEPANEVVTAQLVSPSDEHVWPATPINGPYSPPREIDATPPMHDTASAATYETRNDWTPTAIWPIVVASIVFALMHWGQGLAPIPLFFLSCALGYLYRQTGSLVPSIIVHFVLNGFTMCVTLLQLL